VDTYLQVVTSQTASLASERNETDIQRRRMDATVLLIKALGGGWNVSTYPNFEIIISESPSATGSTRVPARSAKTYPAFVN